MQIRKPSRKELIGAILTLLLALLSVWGTVGDTSELEALITELFGDSTEVVASDSTSSPVDTLPPDRPELVSVHRFTSGDTNVVVWETTDSVITVKTWTDSLPVPQEKVSIETAPII